MMICKQPDQTSSRGQRSVPDFLQCCSWIWVIPPTPLCTPRLTWPIWQFCEWRRKSWTGLNGTGLELLVFLSCYIVLIRSAFVLRNTDWLYRGGTVGQYLCTFLIFNQANITIDSPGRRMDFWLQQSVNSDPPTITLFTIFITFYNAISVKLSVMSPVGFWRDYCFAATLSFC